MPNSICTENLLKGCVSNVSTVLSLDNGDIITNPCDTYNTFNNYFASLAEITEKP